MVQYTEEQIKRVEESIRIRHEAEPVELVRAVLVVNNPCIFDKFLVDQFSVLQSNPLKFWMPKVKRLQKVFTREEKRRKELPLELKQKIWYDIVRRLQDLGDNGSLAQQRGILLSTTILCSRDREFSILHELSLKCVSYPVLHCSLGIHLS